MGVDERFTGVFGWRPGPAVRFPVVFLGLSLAILALLTGPLAETVRPFVCRQVAIHSHGLLRLLGENTHLVGTVVSAPERGHAFEVIYACTSVPSTVLLVSAMLAFPSSWRRKLVGIVLGVLVLYIANLARLVMLFYCYIYQRQLYDRLHLTVWQALLVVLAVFVFFFWATWGSRREMSDAA